MRIHLTKRQLAKIYELCIEHRNRERNAVADYRRHPQPGHEGAVHAALEEAVLAEDIMDRIHAVCPGAEARADG